MLRIQTWVLVFLRLHFTNRVVSLAPNAHMSNYLAWGENRVLFVLFICCFVLWIFPWKCWRVYLIQTLPSVHISYTILDRFMWYHFSLFPKCHQYNAVCKDLYQKPGGEANFASSSSLKLEVGPWLWLFLKSHWYVTGGGFQMTEHSDPETPLEIARRTRLFPDKEIKYNSSWVW